MAFPSHMCGIIGVTNSSEVAKEIFLGLQNLQHRGQDGGGIVTLDETGFSHQHGMGLVDIAFPPENFARLTGTTGIGHTRYATTGKKDMALLQPFFDAATGVAIAHNGNLVNYHSLREQIRQTHPDALATGSDSELILWLLSQELQRHGYHLDGLVKSLKVLSETLVGSYSVVGIAKDIGLFAFRDPNGLRPLVMGSRPGDQADTTTYAFASESMALEFIGYSDLSNVNAGEVVVVPPQGLVERRHYTQTQVQHCMFEWVYFARVESKMDDLSVYQARFNLGLSLATEVRRLGITPDIVVPVPETSRISAIALAESLNVPFREVLIKNRYVNRTFILESQSARQEAIRRKLYPVASELAGKKILVVDDSIVRGNTAIQIVELMRKCGAQEIYLASTCPPIQYPCYYGIDFPSRQELLAGQYRQEELSGVLGVDKVVYQTLQGLAEALQTKALCTACLSGEYPTDISDASRFETQRAQERNEPPKQEVPAG